MSVCVDMYHSRGNANLDFGGGGGLQPSDMRRAISASTAESRKVFPCTPINCHEVDIFVEPLWNVEIAVFALTLFP